MGSHIRLLLIWPRGDNTHASATSAKLAAIIKPWYLMKTPNNWPCYTKTYLVMSTSKHCHICCHKERKMSFKKCLTIRKKRAINGLYSICKDWKCLLRMLVSCNWEMRCLQNWYTHLDKISVSIKSISHFPFSLYSNSSIYLSVSNFRFWYLTFSCFIKQNILICLVRLRTICNMGFIICIIAFCVEWWIKPYKIVAGPYLTITVELTPVYDVHTYKIQRLDN